MYGRMKLYFIAVLFALVGRAISQLSMLTPSLQASIGDNITLSAKSSTFLPTNLVNWYVSGSALTSNGILSASSSKYSVKNNGTSFSLTIYAISSSDFTVYTLLYLNVPSAISSVNASITEYKVTTAAPYVACDSTDTVIAIFVLLIIGYFMLVVANTLIFTITRTQRSKVECCDITMLVVFLQVSMAFISVLIIIWITSFALTQYANYLISSIFGLASYLCIWIGILYFQIMFVKEENMNYVTVYTLVGILVAQIGMYIGAILCVTHCGYTTILPTITLDYGRLGIIFATFILCSSLFIMIWSVVFYRYKELRLTMITVSRKGRELVISPGSLISSADGARGSGPPSKGSKIGSTVGATSLPAPPKKSGFETLVEKMPKSIQQFVASMRRKFKKESDDDFKNLVVIPDPKTDPKLGAKKTDLKGSKLNGTVSKSTPRQPTIDKSKASDKNKKGSVDETAKSKSQLPDTTKQDKAQQQKQANVDSKTQKLAIDPKQGGKEDKSKKRKESTPVQIQPVIQVPGQVPPSEKEKKSKKDKKKSKKSKSEDEEEDVNFESADEDGEENDEDKDTEVDSENEDEAAETVKNSDNDDEENSEIEMNNFTNDEEEDSEADKKKKKSKKSKEKEKEKEKAKKSKKEKKVNKKVLEGRLEDITKSKPITPLDKLKAKK